MFLKRAVVYKCEVQLFSGGLTISLEFFCAGVQLNICVSFEAWSPCLCLGGLVLALLLTLDWYMSWVDSRLVQTVFSWTDCVNKLITLC